MNNRDAAEQARSFAGGIGDYWQERLGERSELAGLLAACAKIAVA